MQMAVTMTMTMMHHFLVTTVIVLAMKLGRIDGFNSLCHQYIPPRSVTTSATTTTRQRQQLCRVIQSESTRSSATGWKNDDWCRSHCSTSMSSRLASISHRHGEDEVVSTSTAPSATATTTTTATSTPSPIPIPSEAQRLRLEAERMRVQAEQMEMSLTLQKIESLEGKLSNRIWLERYPDKEAELREQLRRLNAKLNIGPDGSNSDVARNRRSSDTSNNNSNNNNNGLSFFPPVGSSTPTTTTDRIPSSSIPMEETSETTPSSSSLSASSGGTSVDEKSNTVSNQVNVDTSRDFADDDKLGITKSITPSTSSSTTSPSTTTTTMTKINGITNTNEKKKKTTIPPIAGFKDSDLDLYIPVANDIQRMVPNATIEERVGLFRSAPELQSHLKEKLQKMLMKPLEELQTLEGLRKEYLDSTSSRDRDVLKRKIDQILSSLAEDGGTGAGVGPTTYKGSFRCNVDDLPPLSDVELNERIQAVSNLPEILIAIFKQRSGVFMPVKKESGDDTNTEEPNDVDEIREAILLNYYEAQTQLLEQVQYLDPVNDDMKQDFMSAYESMPIEVRRRFASNLGIPNPSSSTSGQVLQELLDRASTLPSSKDMVEVEISMSDPDGYNDIEFIDRSRYLKEFFPAVAKLEGSHPPLEVVDHFVSQCLERNSFMVTSKPERVVGGFYIRGQNLLADKDDHQVSAATTLIQQISERLAKNSTLSDQIEFFYILDPSPLTDEEMLFGPEMKPIVLITSKNPNIMYQMASPLKKSLVTLVGMASAILFSFGSCALNPAIMDRFYNSLDAATEPGIPDIQWFVDLFFPTSLALGGILLVHEVAHKIAAAIYKFDIGVPNIIPSITTGVTGSITSIKSPPPNLRALFDFAIAGPLAGLSMSLALLVSGLQMTQTLSLTSNLPVLPVDFVRSSSLGGGLVQYFLGSMAVLPDQGPNAFVELHPFAVAGFIGCIVNALALLPLGNTDGGRISLAMFGRRGAFVTKLFSTLALTAAGLFGLDNVNILLAYVLFTLIWQRELETPMRNEVDELDFSRGLIGIGTAIAVGLILIPMV